MQTLLRETAWSKNVPVTRKSSHLPKDFMHRNAPGWGSSWLVCCVPNPAVSSAETSRKGPRSSLKLLHAQHPRCAPSWPLHENLAHKWPLNLLLYPIWLCHVGICLPPHCHKQAHSKSLPNSERGDRMLRQCMMAGGCLEIMPILERQRGQGACQWKPRSLTSMVLCPSHESPEECAGWEWSKAWKIPTSDAAVHISEGKKNSSRKCRHSDLKGNRLKTDMWVQLCPSSYAIRIYR